MPNKLLFSALFYHSIRRNDLHLYKKKEKKPYLSDAITI